MNVTLYSTGCPRCMILQSKLAAKNISCRMVTDREYMLQLGLDEMPVLEVNGQKMNYKEAMSWIEEHAL